MNINYFKKAKTLFSIGCLLAVQSLTSQVATNYTFSLAGGTFNQISGGSVVGGPTDDDAKYQNLDIGFTFHYNGRCYTKFGIGSNGYVVLGPTNWQDDYFMISNNVVDSNFIAVLNNDTQLGFVTNGSVTAGSTDVIVSSTVGITIGSPISGLPGNLFGFPVGTTVSSIGTNSFVASVAATSNYTNEIYFNNGEIRYQTLGSAPNRTLVVQWLRERKFGSGAGVDDCFNYQLHLCETTNKISVVYGDCSNGINVGTYEVGLRGGNFFDYNNCDNFNGWLNTVPGVNNFDFCALDLGFEPPSGLTFNWDTNVAATIPVVSVSAPGGTIVCSSAVFTLTGNGANTYTWTPGGTSSSITPSITANTVYSVTGTANNACVASAQITMSVVQIPTITVSGTSSVCSGASGTLTASGASTYSWSNNALGSTATVSPLANTTYTVYGTDANSVCTSQATHLVLVYILPTVSVSASSTTLCAGQSVTLTASGASSYSWNSGATGSSIVETPASSTVLIATGTASYGCTNTGSVSISVSPCTGIENNSSSMTINAYPNPTSDEFTLIFDTHNEKTVEILDMTGRIIFSDVTSDVKMKLNLAGYSNGIYFVKVQNKDVIEMMKVVKQ